jgi:hypothetical protein
MIPRSLLMGVAMMLVIVLAMGFYLRHLSRSAAEMQRLAEDNRPVAPPAAGPTETVTLFVADDASATLHAKSTQIPLPSGRQQRAGELLRALLRIYQQPNSPHPLAQAADIRSIYLVDPGVAVIDVNAAFADQHRSGILEEQLTVDSLVQTVAANVPGILRVRILVEGDTRETLAGHADLSEFFDVANVSQSISQTTQ